jgi:CBS domain containing-hemolysin-like protein
MNETIFSSVLVVVTVAVAAACSVADGALMTVESDPSAAGSRDIPEIRDRERAHRALSFARMLALLACGMGIAQLVGMTPDTIHTISPDQPPLALAIALLVVAIVEGGGRAVGMSLGPGALRYLVRIVRAAEWLLALPLGFGSYLDAALCRIFPSSANEDEERESSAERFLQVVAAEAEVSRSEEAIMHGIFELSDTEVREVMVPRVDIVGVEASTPWSEVLDRVRSSEHARIPVYAETLDEIIGILYTKDLLPAVVAGEEPDGGWTKLMRPPTFIPTSKPIDKQLRDFKSSRTHIAIVSDEYGGTAGIITIEDILEEIVGEIQDEYDEEEPPVVQEQGRKFWVAGRVTLDELSDVIGHDFDTPDVTTVGGLVYTLFERVPRAGEAVTTDGFRIIVERVRRRRIERVYFERLEPATTRTGE